MRKVSSAEEILGLSKRPIAIGFFEAYFAMVMYYSNRKTEFAASGTLSQEPL